jgi:Flp pilus assembly protein CpaB
MNRHFTLRSWILLSLLSLAPTDCDRLWPASYDRESYALCATAKKPGVSFAEGQVRTESCSVPETEDTAGPSLPAGMCASTVSLPQESVVGGLLYPGCAVDVLVKSKVRSNTGKDAISTTVLKDVRVLAVDQQRKAPTPADSEPNEIRQKRHHLTGGNEILVTLVLGREQAEFLQTAVEHGEISLTIREPLHAQAILSEQQFSAAKSFDAVWGIINDEFWDPNFNGMDWEGARSRYKPQALVTEDHESFAVVVNRMLKELKTSHTRYFTRWEPDYYTLQAALISGSLARHGTSDTSLVEKHEPGLYSSKAKPHRVGIGVVTKLIEGRHYVSAVLSSSPAEEAGIVLGDWLVEVNGRSFHPIHSFEDNAGRELELTVQRGPLQSTGRSIKIVPVDEEERGMFEKDSYDRVTHIEHKGHRFSYIRLWWLAG